MKRSATVFLTIILCCYFFSFTQGQTLITLGDQAVSKQEFLNAFNKNSTVEKPGEKAFREYLDLYIRYKLKVKAAYDSKIDQKSNQIAELTDFRNQVIDSYLNDETSFQRLVKEAVERSKKDIHVAHIYIPFAAESNDTVKAWKIAQDAYKELQRGTEFGNVAALYSGDTSARANKGDIGYITAFTLPYAFETIIFSLPVGKVSRPFKSAAGYHIFKNLGERKAAGNIKAAQILFAFPPDADNAFKETLKQKADSVYNALQKGASFNELAIKYNTDRVTSTTNGEMQEFGVGRFEPGFENAAFALTTANQVSKPILTSHGYHILRLIQRIPLAADSNEAELYDRIKVKVENDPRIEVSKNELTRKLLNTTGIKTAPINLKHLMIYSDSIFQQKNPPVFPGITNKTVLFSLPKQKVYVSEWVKYLNDIHDVPGQTRAKNTTELLQQFKEKVAQDYYRNHLEEFNAEFARQLKEFKEGNMLFEIMQTSIWDKASGDTVALKKYYAAHKDKYIWDPSADVIMININDVTIVNDFKDKLLKNVSDWRKIADAYEGRVQADSGRYELNQLPSENNTVYKAGTLTNPVTNQQEGITSMMYILKTYPEKAPRNFEDAKGLVLNDYQQVLEEKWIEELKKKYPVHVNEAVLKTLWQ
jgi:peptidyl-prolyl cis-trans isomerase SurA